MSQNNSIFLIVIALIIFSIIAIFFIRKTSAAKTNNPKELTLPNQKITLNSQDIIYVACDAGMGSSATGASMLRKKIQEADLPYQVKNLAINDLPENAKLVITHQDLTPRAQQRLPQATHLSLKHFLDRKFYEQLIYSLSNNQNLS